MVATSAERVNRVGAWVSRSSMLSASLLIVKEGPTHFKPLADLCVAGDVSIDKDRTFGLDEVDRTGELSTVPPLPSSGTGHQNTEGTAAV